MSKMDLIKGPAGGTGKGPQGRKKMGKEIGRYLDTDTTLLLEDANKQTNPRFHALNQAIVNLVSGGLPSSSSVCTDLRLTLPG
jgi:hypothetical protein